MKIFIIILLLLIYSIFFEPNFLLVKELNIPNKQLEGLKIVLIGDLHIKPHQGKRLNRIVAKINKQKPDLVLSVGDFIAGHSIEATLPIEKIALSLAKINSKYGIYTVLGNHDFWYDAEQITNVLEKNGINVLNNTNCKIKINNSDLYIAGVEDLTTSQADITKALRNTKKPTILLTHSPDIFPNIPNNVFLTLAGHTHGGQIRIPMIGALIVPSDFGNKYSYGLVNENDKSMIITKGIGTSILPVRFCCFPEILVINFV